MKTKFLRKVFNQRSFRDERVCRWLGGAIEMTFLVFATRAAPTRLITSEAEIYGHQNRLAEKSASENPRGGNAGAEIETGCAVYVGARPFDWLITSRGARTFRPPTNRKVSPLPRAPL